MTCINYKATIICKKNTNTYWYLIPIMSLAPLLALLPMSLPPFPLPLCTIDLPPPPVDIPFIPN